MARQGKLADPWSSTEQSQNRRFAGHWPADSRVVRSLYGAGVRTRFRGAGYRLPSPERRGCGETPGLVPAAAAAAPPAVMQKLPTGKRAGGRGSLCTPHTQFMPRSPRSTPNGRLCTTERIEITALADAIAGPGASMTRRGSELDSQLRGNAINRVHRCRSGRIRPSRTNTAMGRFVVSRSQRSGRVTAPLCEPWRSSYQKMGVEPPKLTQSDRVRSAAAIGGLVSRPQRLFVGQPRLAPPVSVGLGRAMLPVEIPEVDRWAPAACPSRVSKPQRRSAVTS